jgi:putative tricarboxylic transport membrane protein
MHMLSELYQGTLVALSPHMMLWILVGTGIGLVLGVLPAIGGPVAVVLFLPLTYGMDLATALAFLMSIYVAVQFGDSVASILLNIPGGPSTVSSCWEGYPMARRGEGARAIGIAIFGSMVGGLFGCVIMVALAWPLTALAMRIGPPEYFALGIMAISLISIASKGETIKGLIMGCVGFSLSFVGSDPVSGFIDRFSFGSVYFAGGIPLMAVVIGVFAMAQIIRMFEEGGSIVQETSPNLTIRAALEGFLDVLRHPLTVIRSLGIGIYIGILPVLGPGTACVSSYLVEKQFSREKERFGHGVPSGLVATEIAKGCCSVGDMIPTFMLGIPGSATGAIMLAAFLLHGVQAGPQFLLSGSTPFIVFSSIIVAQMLIVVTGLPLIKVLGPVVRTPNSLLAPILTVLCFIGAFADRNLGQDILLMIAFGIFGYFLERFKYSLISFIIGVIIAPMIEENFHRTLGMGYGSIGFLWTRPIAVTFLVITFLFLSWPYLKGIFSWFVGKAQIHSQDTASDFAPEKVTFGEITLLIGLSVWSIFMLVESRSYPEMVGLFPTVLSYLLLGLIIWLSGYLVLRRVQWTRGTSIIPSLSRDSMSWQWSMGTFLLYFFLTYSIGFLPATAIYMIGIPFLLRYQRKRLILVTGVVYTISVAVFVKLLGLVFPAPYFTIPF